MTGARSAAALAAGCAALAWIVWRAGWPVVAHDVAAGGWALPATAAVFAVQLYLAGLAWRLVLDRAVRPGRAAALRWIREGINTLLPVAQIGGQVAGARLLVQGGVAPVLAVAGTVLDLTVEAGAQLLFTLAGVGVLLLTRGADGWLRWAAGGLGLMLAGLAGFVAVQRLGGLRLVEGGLARLAARWPAAGGWSLEGLHDCLMRRQADGAAMAGAIALHTLSWAMGGVEVWLILAVLGRHVSLLDATVVESLGMAARSAGFAVPGAVGIQEGGFVLACGLFGVPAQEAVALSVLKRLREALVGVPALVVWQREEGRAKDVLS